MPLLPDAFLPARAFRNPHWATIYPYFMRRLSDPKYQRERLELPDGDFLDLDIRPQTKSSVGVIITHGLEGSSSSKYVLGMGEALYQMGWEVVALNLRGCSGVPNRLPISYHSGKTDDLDAAIRYVLKNRSYQKLLLVGFSLGGNLTLKYMGEYARNMPDEVVAAAAISAPTDLWSSVQHIRKHTVYMKWLLQKLQQKAQQRLDELPAGSLPFTAAQIRRTQDFEAFDDMYTAPIHGFETARDYYHQCSSNRFIAQIERPSLLLNALDDPFLGEGCYPTEAAEVHERFYLLSTRHGGHVGFPAQWRLRAPFWHEERVRQFFQALVAPRP